jgi:hypothetical protein
VGSLPFLIFSRLAVFFPILSPFPVVGRSLGAKRIVAHDRASDGNKQKGKLAGFRQDVLIGSILDKAVWARAPYFLVTSFCREGRRRHGFAGSGGSSVATKTGHRTGDHR